MGDSITGTLQNNPSVPVTPLQLGSQRLRVVPPEGEWNGADLVNEEAPDVESLPFLGRDEIIIQGWAHLMSGGPKVGKTTLMAALVRPWLDAGQKVLWLSEEPKSVWRRRLRRLGGDWSLLSGRRECQLPEALATSADIVIVDTIREFIPCADENNAAQRGASLRPWVKGMSKAGKTLILLVHARKGGGSHGEGIAGSHELLAAVDVAIEIERGEGRRRRVETIGREFEGQSFVYEMDESMALVDAGEPRTNATALRENLLALLNPTVAPLATAEVIAALQPAPSRPIVEKALKSLAAEGLVTRTPPLTEDANGQRVTWRLS